MSEKNLVPHLPMADCLSRIVHLTFPRKHDLPNVLQDNIEQIRQQNPDYEVRLYDDADIENFISQEFGAEVASYYHRINPKYGAARADFFRYLCIYRYGGVYLDIKAKVTRPLSSVIGHDDHYILSQWDPNIDSGRFATWGLCPELSHIPGGEFQQWHVIARAGHPFLRAVIEAVIARIGCYAPFRHGCGRHAVVRTTGPIVYSLAIAALLERFPFRKVSIERDLGIYYSIFDFQSAVQHTSLFSSHYGRLTDVVIKGNPWTDTIFRGYQDCLNALRNIKASLRKVSSLNKAAGR